MIKFEKPIFKEEDIWCNFPESIEDIEKPSDSKIDIGWKLSEIPKHNFANWQDNITSHFYAYINQEGILPWDSDVSYTKGSVVKFNNLLYFSLVDNNLNNDPTDINFWKPNKTKLSDYYDVQISNLQDGQILAYKEDIKKWINDDITIDFYFEPEENIILGYTNYSYDYSLNKIDFNDIKNELLNYDKEKYIILYNDKWFFEKLNSIKIKYKDIKNNLDFSNLSREIFKKSSKTDLGIFDSEKTENGYIINLKNEDTYDTYDTSISIKNQKRKLKDYNNSISFVKNEIWNVPSGVSEIMLHVVGGGGAGIRGKNPNIVYYGGKSGEYIRQIINVNDGDILNIRIGSGGSINAAEQNGFNGEKTIVNISGSINIDIIADGGAGGSLSDEFYKGDGGKNTNPYTNKDYYDGIYVGIDLNNEYNIDWIKYWDEWINGYGGQSSAFADGGSRTGVIPMYGAGGAAVHISDNYLNNDLFCAGGNGLVIIEY